MQKKRKINFIYLRAAFYNHRDVTVISVILKESININIFMIQVENN